MTKEWENEGERAGRIEGGRQQRPKVLCPTYQSARVSRQIRTSELCKQWIFGIAGIAYHFVLACACIPRARAQSTAARANTIPNSITQETKNIHATRARINHEIFPFRETQYGCLCCMHVRTCSDGIGAHRCRRERHVHRPLAHHRGAMATQDQ